ncbi:hypothetical protein NX059_012062 [Plenodomus lindquistii]|nr:hypothetical protein NX059_012062 [Plenodomus lindquistii]
MITLSHLHNQTCEIAYHTHQLHTLAPSDNTITPAEETVDVKPFRFLDLPAELRNNVYEYALAQDTVPEAHKDLTERNGARHDDNEEGNNEDDNSPGDDTPQDGDDQDHGAGINAAPSLSDNDSKPKYLECKADLRRYMPYRYRNFLALTQVCHDIRKEFRPLYLQSPMVMTKDDTEKYLAAFFPGCFDDAENDAAAGIVADITIYFSEKETICEDGSVFKAKLSNLVPLLHLYPRAPNLRIAFDDVWMGPELNYLFNNLNPGTTRILDKVRSMRCAGSEARGINEELKIEFTLKFSSSLRGYLYIGPAMYFLADNVRCQLGPNESTAKGFVRGLFSKLFLPSGSDITTTVPLDLIPSDDRRTLRWSILVEARGSHL